SKPFSDFLRNYCITHASTKIKASHSHELIAAYFGHKSNISLLNDNAHPLSAIKIAQYVIPDIKLMDERRQQLNDFPEALPSTNILAKAISDFIKSEQYFAGDIWLTDDLENYIAEELLPSLEEVILDELAGLMSETNAIFDESPAYESNSVVVNFKAKHLEISATGILHGEQQEDKMYSGSNI